MMRVHASSVAIDGRTVLLFGASGAGKSDLALRLIDEGAVLVSDDYTELEVCGARLIARAPSTIRGRLEVRGIGIVRVAAADDVPVSLAVELGAPAERLPEAATRMLLGIAVPLVTIDPRTASASAKVRVTLEQVAPSSRSD